MTKRAATNSIRAKATDQGASPVLTDDALRELERLRVSNAELLETLKDVMNALRIHEG